MGRVRGSTDRVCVRVGGPIDFLAHVKAAREGNPPQPPFFLLRPPATPEPPPRDARDQPFPLRADVSPLTPSPFFPPSLQPTNALTSRLPPMYLSRRFSNDSSSTGGVWGVVCFFFFLFFLLGFIVDVEIRFLSGGVFSSFQDS